MKDESEFVMRRLVWIALGLVASGCDLPGRPREADRPVAPDQVVDFSVLYGQNCAGCHGAGGKLGPAPPLNDPTFLAIVPDQVLARVIAEGRPGTPMPAFAKSHGGTLTDAQVRVLAEGLKPQWQGSPRGPHPLPAYAAPETGSGSSERGLKVFARACAGCHGDGGEGSEEMAGAIHDPAFLALISNQALRRYAITGRPDLGMPSFAGKSGRDADFQPLTATEIDDLVALLASWREAR
jgi:mono/diheme cytochrome c family protein